MFCCVKPKDGIKTFTRQISPLGNSTLVLWLSGKCSLAVSCKIFNWILHKTALRPLKEMRNAGGGGSSCLNQEYLTGINSCSRGQTVEPEEFGKIHLVFLRDKIRCVSF